MKKIISSIVLLSSVTTLMACGTQPSSKPSSSAPSTATPSSTPAASNNTSTPKTMKFALAVAKDHPLSKGAYKFAELVKKESGGSISVEVFTDGQLGGDVQLMNAVAANTLQVTTISTGPIMANTPKIGVFDLPFLFKDAETAHKVLDGPIGQGILKDLEKSNLIGVGYWENGFRHLTTSTKEVKSVSDLKGLKIRTLESKVHLDTWKELGANPVPMPFTELFSALEGKVIDGQENPYPNIMYQKFYEVQKYMTNTGHVYSPAPLLVSKKFWDTLNDQEKKAVQKASDEAKDFQREVNKKENDDALKVLKDKGMVVNDLTPQARQEFVDKLKPIYDKYKKEFGEDLVNKVLEATK